MHLLNPLILGIAAFLRHFPFPGKTFLWARIVHYYPGAFRSSCLVRFSEGFRMRLDLRDLVQAFMVAGCYERRTAFFTGRLLRSGDCFVDGGAHIGFYSCLAGARIGASGAIYSFEPNPRTFPVLSDQLALNPGIPARILPHALAADCHPVQFHLPPSEWNSQALAGMGRKNLFETQWETIDVAAVTLDQFVRDERIPSITLCKLDLEGEEPAALRGAQECLGNGTLESLIVEATDGTLEALIDALKPFSFEVIQDLRFRTPCRNIADLRLHPIKATYATNILFARGKIAARWKKLGPIKFCV